MYTVTLVNSYSGEHTRIDLDAIPAFEDVLSLNNRSFKVNRVVRNLIPASGHYESEYLIFVDVLPWKDQQFYRINEHEVLVDSEYFGSGEITIGGKSYRGFCIERAKSYMIVLPSSDSHYFSLKSHHNLQHGSISCDLYVAAVERSGDITRIVFN